MSIALVTGAAGIVGPGICAALKAAGWKVAAADRSQDHFARYNGNHDAPLEADMLIAADLSRPEAAACLVAEVRRQLGPIGLLVNNATAHNQPLPLERLDAKICEQIWHVDLLAPLLLTQAAADDLAGGGMVINISSVRVLHITPGHLPYITAKAAIEKMTEVMAVELSARDIRVNCLRLGSVPGDAFLRPALELLPSELGAKLRDDILPKHFAAAGQSSTLGPRCGTPEDIGRTIAFLASSAGRFINGAVIPVDGGYVLKQHQHAAASTAAPSHVHQWQSDPKGQVRAWLKASNIQHEL